MRWASGQYGLKLWHLRAMFTNPIELIQTFFKSLLNKALGDYQLQITAQYVGVYLIVLLGIVFSLVLFNGISSAERQSFRSAFNDASVERVGAIENAMTKYANSLHALAAFYQAVVPVDHETFDVFASSLIKQNPGIQALEWVPRIHPEHLRDYERRAQQWFPHYRIFELDQAGNVAALKPRPAYYPIYYVVPRAGNEEALGFDLGSNSFRLDALRRAAGSGELVATQRLKLVQERAQQFGFLLIAPVYRTGMPSDTESRRETNLVGFVLAVFRIGDIVKEALSHMTAQNIGVVVKDMSAPAESQFLHYFSPTGAYTPPETPQLSYSQTIQIGGRVWSVHCVNEPGYGTAGSQWIAWSALLNGMVITFLIAGYLLSLISRNDKIAAVVKERTEALRLEAARVSALNTQIAEKAAAFRKFVPKQFLEMLGFSKEESIVKGHGTAREFTVMFSDIRGFTEISGQLLPEQVFQIIDSYIGCIAAIVEKNGGFIDHSDGDGVLIIFDEATDAVRAAIDLQHAVQQQPMRLRDNGDEEIWITLGIGIHRGVVMAGTVGTATRMQTSVFGDTVNIAARIQELNKNFGTNVLISEEVRQNLEKLPDIITRPLGKTKMSGVAKTVRLHEVLNALPSHRLIKICADLQNYEAAIDLLCRGRRTEAGAKLQECARTDPDDGVCRELLRSLEQG
jgi:class 3 adenylate cyclase/CHASE1-domain containing sensor protein